MEKGGEQLADAPSFVDLCTLHQHAMRYYRLWIYACNTVLALSTLIFGLFAISILVDPRITLLRGVDFHPANPTFIYAYLALILQCGVLQAIGCIGALRLNQKLLNTYWTLLLVLMIGDIFVGLVWAFRLDRIKSDLMPNLKQRLNSQYENDPEFTRVWDWVQNNDICCGVEGPTDFLHYNDSSAPLESPGLPADLSSVFHHPKLPSACCTFSISPYTPPPPNPTSTPITQGSQLHQLRSNRVTEYYHPNPILGPSSLFGTGSTGTHNRRKILHSSRKHGTDPSYNPHPHRHLQTTTESSTRRGTPFGICSLPPELLTMYHKNYIYVRISDTTTIDLHSFMESGSGHHYHLSEDFHSDSSSSSVSTELPSSATSTSSMQDWRDRHSSAATPSIDVTSSSPIPSHSSSTSSIPPSYVLVSMNLTKDGCGVKILEWVDHASDVLFVIGFCIIVFLKGCFVAILRYEIKEMIQKIKLLNGEDEGRTAAMNELIGLTSLYEGGNEDDHGEREGLMATSASDQGGQDTTVSTNLDTIGSDKRKDSVISREHYNCLVGNHVGNHNRKSHMGNHNPGIGSNNSPTSTTVSTPTTTVVVTGGGGKRMVKGSFDHPDIEEDFDSGCALVGKEERERKQQVRNSDNTSSSEGARSLPKNGNNNTNTSGLGGVTGSASAPIPIDSMAKA